MKKSLTCILPHDGYDLEKLNYNVLKEKHR